MNQATTQNGGGPVKKATHVRQGRKITKLGQPAVTKKEKVKEKDAEGKEVVVEKVVTVKAEVPREETMYPSNNLAKKASRQLQMDTDKQLGLGTVRVKEHKKPQQKQPKAKPKEAMERNMKVRGIQPFVYNKGKRRPEPEDVA